MGQLRDDAKNIEPIQNESKAYFSDTETPFDDPEVPLPQLPDELVGEMESGGLQYFQDTVPVDDACPFGDAFETQKVDLDGETQLMDVCDDTQVVNLDGDTQVIDDYDVEVLIESDGQESDETEVLCDTQKLSDDDFVRKGGTCSVGLKNMLNTDLSWKSDGNSKAQLGSLSNEVHDSGSTVRVKGFTSIRVASFRQSGLAARKGGMLSCRDSTRVGNDANRKNDPEEDDPHIKESGNENASKVGNSAARKLFMDDVVTEIQQADDDMGKRDGTGGVSQFAFQHDPAGLSYISSQEPGDLSQANALDVVGRFLELNAIESDQDVTFTKSFKEKSKPVSIAKGTQSLARKATVRSIDGESGIFKWDDDLEDEGGGEFFQKKKELFFGTNGAQRKRSDEYSWKTSCLNSKCSLTTQQNRDKMQLGSNRKLKDAIFSDSRLSSKNSTANIESSELKEPSFKKNLLEELNEEMNTTGDRPVDASSDKCLPNNQDVGFDTQMAADAMETLQFAVSMTENVSCNSNERSRNMTKSSDRNEVNELQSLDKSSTKKRACPRNAKVVTRQYKRTKGTDESSKGSLLSSLKQSKHVHRQSDAELSVREPRRAKVERKNLVRNDGEKLSPASKVVGQRKEDGVAVASDLHDGTYSTVSSGRKSLKTNSLHEVLGSTPISHRTRGSMKVSRPKGENNQNSYAVKSDVCELGDVNLRQLCQSNTFSPGKRSRSKLPEVGQKASTQYITRSKRSKIDCTSSSVDVIQHQKEQSAECADRRIFEKMIDNDKSLDKNGCCIKDSKVKAQTSRHSGAQRDVDNMISAEGGKGSRGEKASPIDSSKPYAASANTTPINSTTRTSAASPICMGDEYHKQSCRKNLLRSSLMKELSGMKTTACPEFTGAAKGLRKRRDITDIRAMFSRHLDADVIKQQKKILGRLGASVTSSMSDATHFITDKFVRTRNMLEAIAYGKPVVTELWLESCGQANCFIDERTHILRDAKKEREFGFSMPVSLAQARQHPLLQGHRVLITPNTKPGKEILASLVKAVHGLAVERLGRSALKDERLPDDILVLSCEEDYEICVPFLEKGAAVYSSELLLNGIVTQRLEYERHRLFMDSVKRTRSTIWVKKNGDQYLPVSKS